MHAQVSNESNLVDQRIWDDAYVGLELGAPAERDQIRPWLQRYIPAGSGRCFEVGCFPGRYLTTFGDLGYELNGVDLTPRTNTEMVPWLERSGYRVGEFFQGDFFAFSPQERYDVVASFGFIEHFPNFEDVILRHAELVSNHGYLVIATPNFRGIVQKALHSWLDRENFDRHIIESMNPKRWSELVARQGFETVAAGHFSRFSFWIEDDGQSRVKKTTAKAIRCLGPVLGRGLPKNQAAYSPFCGLIAKRID